MYTLPVTYRVVFLVLQLLLQFSVNLLLYESIPLVRNKIVVYLKEHGQLPVKIKKSDGWWHIERNNAKGMIVRVISWLTSWETTKCDIHPKIQKKKEPFNSIFSEEHINQPFDLFIFTGNWPCSLRYTTILFLTRGIDSYRSKFTEN